MTPEEAVETLKRNISTMEATGSGLILEHRDIEAVRTLLAEVERLRDGWNQCLVDLAQEHARANDAEAEVERLKAELGEAGSPPPGGSLRQRYESLRDLCGRLMGELQNIADAKPSEWGEDMADQFKPWTQNRARHTLAEAREVLK